MPDDLSLNAPTALRIFLVSAHAGARHFGALIRDLYQLEERDVKQIGRVADESLPPRCLVHFAAGFDALLLNELRAAHFTILCLFRHPLDNPAELASGCAPALEWSCLEDAHTLRHEEIVSEPIASLVKLRRILGDFDPARALNALSSRAPTDVSNSAYAWMETTAPDLAKQLYQRHTPHFAALGYPEPREIADAPSTPAEARQLRRALLALDDAHLQREHARAYAQQSEQLRRELRVCPIPRPTPIPPDNNDAVIRNLQRLLYGSSPGKHLYRAWQVLIGNPHYKRHIPAAPTPVIVPAAPVSSLYVDDYIDLHIDGVHVKFHQAALSDPRGTGRVARELLSAFRRRPASPANPDPSPAPVHFFSAPHWGPRDLPPRTCLLVHDAIPMEIPDYPEDQRRRFAKRTGHVLHQAAQCITISQTSVEAINRHFSVAPEDIIVIPNGISHLPVATSLPSMIPDAPYVVYIGGGDDHKNLEIVFDALCLPAAADLHLVLIGENLFLQKRALRFASRDRVHFAGRLDDASAGAVIEKARAFVFPSLNEGFGLPPFEAALLGVPSICSRRPAMTELMADAALFADPDSPHEWAEKLHALAHHPTFARNLGQAAKDRAEKLTWDAAASAYLEIFKRIAAS